MLPGYPALGWATTQVYPAQLTARPGRNRRHFGDLIRGKNRESVPFLGDAENLPGRTDTPAVRIIADDFPPVRESKLERTERAQTS